MLVFKYKSSLVEFDVANHGCEGYSYIPNLPRLLGFPFSFLTLYSLFLKDPPTRQVEVIKDLYPKSYAAFTSQLVAGGASLYLTFGQPHSRRRYDGTTLAVICSIMYSLGIVREDKL